MSTKIDMWGKKKQHRLASLFIRMVDPFCDKKEFRAWFCIDGKQCVCVCVYVRQKCFCISYCSYTQRNNLWAFLYAFGNLVRKIKYQTKMMRTHRWLTFNYFFLWISQRNKNAAHNTHTRIWLNCETNFRSRFYYLCFILFIFFMINYYSFHVYYWK